MRKTPWFPPEVDPVHPGPYQRDFSVPPTTQPKPKDVAYSVWDGATWHSFGNTPEEAVSRVPRPLGLRLPWRGLTKPAKA